MNSISDNEKQIFLDDFKVKLPELRKKLGLSQTELASKVGLSRQSISAIERGCVHLTWSIFLEIMLVIMANEPDAFKILEKQDILKRVLVGLKSNS